MLQNHIIPTLDSAEPNQATSSGIKIWIDLENTPHIPFFKPIERELQKRGYLVVFTARDAFQTCDMATANGFNFTKIGRHYGKNRFLKVLGLCIRSLQLISFVLREKPVLALNHGSRAQILVCNLLRIPSVMIMDYEYSRTLPMIRPKWEIIPDVISKTELGCRNNERIRKYLGIKEDVYVPEFKPDASIKEQLGLDKSIIVTVRPPATEAHYHNLEAEFLFNRLMKKIGRTDNVKVILLPRNKAQEIEIRTNHPDWFKDSKTIIPEGVVDGLNLLWHSDLAVSGGGTMNREAAALGIPVYSIFRGPTGAVDLKLEQEGRLIILRTVEEMENKIRFVRRNKGLSVNRPKRETLKEIMNHIDFIIDCETTTK